MDNVVLGALIAGLGVAAAAGPLGCVIIWRRLSYFGDTLAHSALLGAAAAFLFEINITVAVFGVAALIAVTVLFLQRRAALPPDSLLGLLAHSALALGLLALAFISRAPADGHSDEHSDEHSDGHSDEHSDGHSDEPSGGHSDIPSDGHGHGYMEDLLFGDIFSVTGADIVLIYGGGAAALAVLAWIWRSLFAATVSPELAEAEGMRPVRTNLIFMLLLAAVVAIAMKITGALLITALLIIPAAAARRFSSGPEQMALFASIIGAASVAAGIFAAGRWDLLPGPAIVVAALVFFVLSLLPPAGLMGRKD